jgi:NAD(P)-dependent dehydrogenase (short-subunit alcohol dehydrogenase family)
MTARLFGKRALVTGASKGIGRSIALVLAGAGARTVVTARKMSNLRRVTGEIERLGGNCLAVACDVTEQAQVNRLKTAVNDELGGVDVLVNNAGVSGSHKFVEHPDELWHQMIDVNLHGVYYVTKAFVPGMLERRWGRIVNVASVAAKEGGKYISAYAAAKHGVLGLTRSLAIELAPYITVNAICPGYVDTPMTGETIATIVGHTGMSPEQARAVLENMNPQGRLIAPEEVANKVLDLVQAPGITGQAIDLDV